MTRRGNGRIGAGRREPVRVLITAGPTREPIDAVRYLGNRSSGTLGCALADEAARRGHGVTLLLGPTHRTPVERGVRMVRFETTADLDRLLREELPGVDVLVMAAAVADYRPVRDDTEPGGKKRREPGGMVLRLEATPDLLAGCASRRRAGQVLVGFALEPRAEMQASAKKKLARKGVDLIVANPLETMNAPDIEAVVYGPVGSVLADGRATPGPVAKEHFGGWLLDVIEGEVARVRSEHERVSGGVATQGAGPSGGTGAGCGRA